MNDKMTEVSGYVQQDDLFVGTLTVREHLFIQARLRLVGWTDEQRRDRVFEVFDAVF